MKKIIFILAFLISSIGFSQEVIGYYLDEGVLTPIMSGSSTGGVGLSAENQLKIDNLNVTKRITVSADNVVETVENSKTSTSPFEGKVETLINGNYTYLINNTAALGVLHTIVAGYAVDSVYVKRNDPNINFTLGGRGDLILPADDYDGFYLRPGKVAVGKRVANNEYEYRFDGYPFEGVAACTADPNQLFIEASALSDLNCNESNTLPTVIQLVDNAQSNLIANNDTEGGDFAVRYFSGETTSNPRIEYDFPVVNGETVTWSIRYRVEAGATAEFNFWDGVTSTPNIQLTTDGNWHTATGVVTGSFTGTGTAKLYIERNASAGVGTVDINEISFISQN